MKMKLNCFKSTPKPLNPDVALAEFRKIPEFSVIENFKNSFDNIRDIEATNKPDLEEDIFNSIDNNIKIISDNPLLKTLNLSNTGIFPITAKTVSNWERGDNYTLDVISWKIKSFELVKKESTDIIKITLEKMLNSENITVFIPVTEEIKVKFDKLLKKKNKLTLKNILTYNWEYLPEHKYNIDNLSINSNNFDNFFKIAYSSYTKKEP